TADALDCAQSQDIMCSRKKPAGGKQLHACHVLIVLGAPCDHAVVAEAGDAFAIGIQLQQEQVVAGRGVAGKVYRTSNVEAARWWWRDGDRTGSPGQTGRIDRARDDRQGGGAAQYQHMALPAA